MEHGNCFLVFSAETEIEIGPDSFEIGEELNFAVDVDVLGDIILGEEVVGICSLEDGEHPIAQLEVAVGLVGGESRQMVPWLVLALQHNRRVPCKVPEPEPEPILARVLQFFLLQLDQGDRVLIEPCICNFLQPLDAGRLLLRLFRLRRERAWWFRLRRFRFLAVFPDDLDPLDVSLDVDGQWEVLALLLHGNQVLNQEVH